MAAAHSPHIRDTHSPLTELIKQALRQQGKMSPETIQGDMELMYIEFANEVLETIMMHPLWVGGTVPYYKSASEAREVPDTIMRRGLIFYGKDQQGAKDAGQAAAIYLQVMNRHFARTHDDVGNAAIELEPWD